jgi:AraC-like DNA-binding protein
MSDITMEYRQPGPALAEHVSFFYHFTQSNESFTVVDRASFAQLRFILSGRDGRNQFVDGTVQMMPDIYVLGPTTGNTQVSGSGYADLIGVGLMPSGWAALVPMDASAAANRLFDAVDLLGPAVLEAHRELAATSDFDERVVIFEALLVRLMGQSSPAFHGFVREVNAWLAESVSPQIAELLERTGMSISQVERRCKRYFGSPPKQLARKYRALRTAIALIHQDADLDTILVEGFYDQSHLIREMKHFTGLTPAAFAAEPTLLNQQIAKRIELERRNPRAGQVIIT